MKNIRMLRIAVLAFAVATLLTLSAAAPFPPQLASANAQDDLVRFTIVNQGDKPIYLWMNGPAYYYLTVEAGTAKIFTPKRGVYSYTITQCGLSTQSTLDLTAHKKMIVPACGYRGGKETKGSNRVDASELIKLMRVNFKNETTGYITIILDGPADFVFVIPKGETKTYTIPKGHYTYTLYACGSIGSGNFYALRQNKTKEFGCP